MRSIILELKIFLGERTISILSLQALDVKHRNEKRMCIFLVYKCNYIIADYREIILSVACVMQRIYLR